MRSQAITEDNGGALAGPREDLERGANVRGALAHVQQAPAGFSGQAGMWEALAVVTNGHSQKVVRGLQDDGGRGSAGMFFNVAQGFLSNAVNGQFELGRQAGEIFRRGEIYVDAGPLGDFLDQTAEGGDQT